jgi:hypothetical protein
VEITTSSTSAGTYKTVNIIQGRFPFGALPDTLRTKSLGAWSWFFSLGGSGMYTGFSIF